MRGNTHKKKDEMVRDLAPLTHWIMRASNPKIIEQYLGHIEWRGDPTQKLLNYVSGA